MDARAERALATDLVIDITTTGRASGEPRTVEIWFHRLNGRYFITGRPGRRDWYANLLADPRLTITFTRSGGATLRATSGPVTDPDARREVLDAVFELEGGAARGSFESWLEGSPIIEFEPES